MSKKIIRGDATNSVDFDLTRLNTFVRQFGHEYILKVGIMGAKTNRKGTQGTTNAEIGAKHEFGSYINNIPRRSFLRMPLHSRANAIINETGKDALPLVASGNILQVIKNLGVSCVGQIHDAFKTRGFGTWPALKPETVLHKIQQNDQPLINTRQLERSITFKVEKV